MAEPARSLGVQAPGKPAFFAEDLPPVADGSFALRTEFSGLSAGTELTYLKGTNPYLSAGWDERYGVFRADRPAAAYPVRSLGYMEVARVTSSRTPALAEGDLVAMAYGHRSAHVADAAAGGWISLPGDLDPLLGVFAAHMGPICANGVLHAAAELTGSEATRLGDGVAGRNVVVTGAGVVGLLTALFAAEHGAAEVAVVDPSPRRLAAARGLGLTALDEREGEPWIGLKERWVHGPNDRGADVAFQCRGQAASLATALRCLRPQGAAIDLAFYQGGAPDLRLGEEFHHNGLTVRCAQIGRVPRGFERGWGRPRLRRETLELLAARGADLREHVITDVVPIDDAPELMLALAERKREVIQAVFAF